jgi:hypothetical protein
VVPTQFGVSFSPQLPPARVFEIAAAQPPEWPPATRLTVLAAASPAQPDVSTSKPGFPTRSPPGFTTVQLRVAGVASTLREPSTATTWKVCVPVARSA